MFFGRKIRSFLVLLPIPRRTKALLFAIQLAKSRRLQSNEIVNRVVGVRMKLPRIPIPLFNGQPNLHAASYLQLGYNNAVEVGRCTSRSTVQVQSGGCLDRPDQMKHASATHSTAWCRERELPTAIKTWYGREDRSNAISSCPMAGLSIPLCRFLLLATPDCIHHISEARSLLNLLLPLAKYPERDFSLAIHVNVAEPDQGHPSAEILLYHRILVRLKPAPERMPLQPVSVYASPPVRSHAKQLWAREILCASTRMSLRGVRRRSRIRQRIVRA